MTDHRKICASDDDGGDIDHSLTLNVNVSWKTIFEIIREAVCSVTSQKSDTGSGIGFQGGVLRVGRREARSEWVSFRRQNKLKI